MQRPLHQSLPPAAITKKHPESIRAFEQRAAGLATLTRAAIPSTQPSPLDDGPLHLLMSLASAQCCPLASALALGDQKPEPDASADSKRLLMLRLWL